MKDHFKYLDSEFFKRWIESDEPEINDYWETWMRENPDKAEELLQHKAFFKAIKFQKYARSASMVDDSWKRLHHKIAPKHRQWRTIYKYAAILGFFILTLFAVRYFVDTTEQPSIVELPARKIEKIAEKGVKLTVQLSDGSTIRLNSGSKIRYPEVFEGDLREVELQGEAYFEVTHDAMAPFVVKTNDTYTRVLGTRFAIRSDADKVQVALVSGKVEILHRKQKGGDQTNQSMMLEPGFKAICGDQLFEKQEIDELHDLGWKDNILVFPIAR
ncbi:MAG: FecR domain-containing protein [Cyclobacteriaceae bacterium]|nr:FecR domain-containing protein [Cyclobacteriaceae bacterium]